MGNHTEGPWRVNKLMNDAVTSQFGLVASVFPCATRNDAGDLLDVRKEEREANALLIASAPDLLEAAQLVIDWFEAERDHDNAGFSERMEMCDASEAAIRAAIAKATGSKP